MHYIILVNQNNMDTLLVVFINPQKFADLLGNNDDIRNKIEVYDEGTGETYYLANSTKVIYLNGDSQIDVDVFDSGKVNTANAVLIPDNHPNIEEYTPTKPFKILHHFTGATQNLRIALLESELFKAIAQETEDPNTSYDKLATAMGGGDLVDAVTEVYEGIKEIDYVLEAKLLLLQKILNGDEVTLLSVVNILKDSSSDKVKRIFDPVFKTTPELEHRVLQAKENQDGNRVSLEKKLTDRTNQFESLNKEHADDIFSTEYQIAFKKLRDALGIE